MLAPLQTVRTLPVQLTAAIRRGSLNMSQRNWDVVIAGGGLGVPIGQPRAPG
jgi:hypothetical protein